MLTSVAILAEFGDVRRFGRSRHAVRHTAWTSPCTNPIPSALPGTCHGKGHRYFAGRCSKPRNVLRAQDLPITITTSRSKHAGGNRAALAVAHKLARRAYHTLRDLGDEALAPVA